MSVLQSNLEYILNEKETKIIPENIKKGVQIFDVVGTLESGGSSDYNAKLVPTDGRITYYITEISAQLDISKVTNMNYMFMECTNLTTIPLLDTSKVTDMNYMFYGCTNLTTIPLLNTSKVTDMRQMFRNCTNLITIPLLDTSKVTNMTYMFYDCTNLSDESLNNILAMCANATEITSNKTLERIGLTSEQATKCTTLSNYSTFTAAGWTTGY